MAHFAEIRYDNNEVIRVIVVSNEDVNNNGGELSVQAEQWVASFHPQDELLKKEFEKKGEIYPQTYWKQCSYNNNFRGGYPGAGSEYVSSLDVFRNKQPFPSWTYDINKNKWLAPVQQPLYTNAPVNIETGVPEILDHTVYKYFVKMKWNEETQRWEAKDEERNEMNYWDPNDNTWKVFI